MSPLRITAALFASSVLAIAACSASGGNNGFIADEDGGPPINSSPIDAGTADVAPDAPGPTAVCGNGKVEGTEACDDGNKADNDGCNGACALEAAFEGDICPGKTVALTQTGQLLHATITGSTKTAFNHYGSACGGGSGRDVVYTFTPTSSGKAIINVTADYPAIISTRSTCTAAGSESKCADITASTGGTKTMEVPVFQNTPVYLFVDGYGGASGTFTIDVDVSLAVCGNGVAELPESCDDGNTTAGDGCNATCALEEGGILSQCPGQPFDLTGVGNAPRKISLAGNTKTQGADTQSPTGCFYWSGNNVVYALKSDVAGSAKLKLTASYAKANVFARSDCGSSSFQLGCTQREGPGETEIYFPVLANQWFYAFVDGDNNAGGPYSLDVIVTPASCGNGVLDGNEECDDANADTGDGCTATCTREPLPATNSCPGHAVTLASQPDGSRKAVISGTTAGNSSKIAACGLTTSSAPDALFRITPDIDGLLSGTVTGAWNAGVQILSMCSNLPDGGAPPVLACSYKANASTNPFILEGLGSVPKTISTPVVAGVTYTVVVKAVSSGNTQTQQGPYKLDLRVTPAQCGNNVIEGTETCDDGATTSGDGCDSSCQLEPTASRSTCAQAESITLTESMPGQHIASIERGTTNLLANGDFTTDADDVCSAPGRNAFFSVTAPVAGVFRATARSTYFDVVLGLRKPCFEKTASNNVNTNPLVCADASTKGAEETVAVPVAAGETLWVVVDTKSATDFGRFQLDVSVTPSVCGDGFFVPSATEACDDGNATAGDGCSPTCTLEPLPGADVCPGTPMTLTPSGTSRKGTVTMSTASLSADYSGACGGNAKDGVVKVTAPISGTLTAKMRGMQNATVHARAVCNDPSSEFFKSSASTCPFVVHDTVSFPVTSGTDYFLFVDGLDGAAGVPTLDVVITP